MKDLVKTDNRVDSNRETIQLHLQSEEGTVPLTDKQKELLTRWEYVDELVRINGIRGREVVAKMVMRRHQVSKQTAYQDIVNAEAVFASSTPLNKKYRIGLRIEFLEQKIDELYGMVKMEPSPSLEGEAPKGQGESEEDILARVARIKGNQEYLHEAKELEKILQKYYHDYPEIVQPRSPKKIIYVLPVQQMPAAPLTADDAMRKAGLVIDITPKNPPVNDTR